MTYKNRSREFVTKDYVGTDYNVNPYYHVDPNDDSFRFIERQRTESWGHPYQMIGRSGYDIGGDFSSEHVRWEGNLPHVVASNGGWLSYDGYISHIAPDTTYPSFDVSVPTKSELYAMGSSAIARTIPTNPNFSLATFAGETFSDGLPKIVGKSVFEHRARHFKDLGDEYLNVEFGWKPFVSDVRSFAQSVMKSEKILTQFRKDSDKQIKRRWDFPESRTYNHQESDPSFKNQLRPALSWLYDYGNPGILQIDTATTRRSWFEGCYTYHLPLGDSQMDRLRYFSAQANKLFGTRLTPATLWELTPWSWAADWFGNIGDIIHNASALGDDGLVIRYGYIMDFYESIVTYTQEGPIGINHGPVINSLSLTRIHTLKRRYRATPYGFGLIPADFTTRQKAIVAALGISRSGL